MDMDTFETMREKLCLSEMSRPVAIGLAAIMVMVAVLAGRFAIDTATAKDFTIDRGDAQLVSPSSEEVGSNGQKSVYVHVTGAVVNPGIYELEEGARVASAVREAGGFAEDAEQESCNLARVVSDGEQIRIPTCEEAEQEAQQSSSPVTTGIAAEARASSLVNINTATAEELTALPGVGSATAQRIVADREASGPFTTPEDLMRVKGIGEKKYDDVKDLICVS